MRPFARWHNVLHIKFVAKSKKFQILLDISPSAKYTTTMLRVFRKINGRYKDEFPDGKEYLLDTENENQPAEFESMEEIFKLFKDEGHDIKTEQDLINNNLNIESVEI